MDRNSAEIKAMEMLGEGNMDGLCALFGETKRFSALPTAIDTPQGRFEGTEGIRRLAGLWLESFGADYGYIDPVIQTRAGGRSVTEFVAAFHRNGKKVLEFPMAVVGDLREDGGIDEARVYFHFKQVPGASAYRRPIFVSSYTAAPSPQLLTGAPRAYFEAMHTGPAADVDKIVGLFGPSPYFGGYMPSSSEPAGSLRKEQLREIYARISSYIPKWLFIHYETVIDDGISCVIEWQHVIHRAGREEGNRLAQAGFAVYEREPGGLLSAVRIIDSANSESEIDWSRESISKEEAEKINYIG